MNVKNIAALTPVGVNYPPFVSINDVQNGHCVEIHVRSNVKEDGKCGDAATISMSFSQFTSLIKNINEYLTPPPVESEVAGAIEAAKTVFTQSWNKRNTSDREALIYISPGEELPFNYGHLQTLITAAQSSAGVAGRMEAVDSQIDFLQQQVAVLESEVAELREFITQERNAIFHAMTRGQNYDIGLAKERMTEALSHHAAQAEGVE